MKNLTFLFLSKFLLFTFCILLFSASFAQITREQADVIVLEHIQNEVISPYFLYVYVNLPNDEGIALTTYHEENMKVKYACWAYYLNEHQEVSETTRHRYLFVKENNGNLLEIITYNDLGTADFTQWELMPLGVNEMAESDIRIYPNPTTGELRIENGELKIENVEIFDIYGRKVLAPSLTVLQFGKLTASQSYDLTVLQPGIYFIKIETEAGIITKKVIKY